MSNRFHLAVELTEPNLSEGINWLQGTWTRRYKGLRHILGRLFLNRCKALLVEPAHALAQVCHYIHLNPVRAGLVKPGAADRYPWNSLPELPDKKRTGWL